MDTGFNYYHGADPSEYDLVVSNSEGGLPRAARARGAAGRGRLLGRRPGVLRAAAGREAPRRLLLRLRGQVPPRLDGRDGRRAEPGGARARVRARRPRLPGRHRPRLARRRRPLQRLQPRDLGLADQPEHHAPLACDRPGLVVVPAVRARERRRRDRLEPLRGDRALVRAGARAARRQRRRRGAQRRTAACSTIRRRPRRWAPARASACSTSTPTRTAPGSCSRSSASASRQARVPDRRHRDRPGPQRGGGGRGRGRGAARVRSRARRRRDRRRLRGLDGGTRGRRRRSGRQPALQPRDRRRRPDGLQVRARRTATTP